MRNNWKLETQPTSFSASGLPTTNIIVSSFVYISHQTDKRISDKQGCELILSSYDLRSSEMWMDLLRRKLLPSFRHTFALGISHYIYMRNYVCLSNAVYHLKRHRKLHAIAREIYYGRPQEPGCLGAGRCGILIVTMGKCISICIMYVWLQRRVWIDTAVTSHELSVEVNELRDRRISVVNMYIRRE